MSWWIIAVLATMALIGFGCDLLIFRDWRKPKALERRVATTRRHIADGYFGGDRRYAVFAGMGVLPLWWGTSGMWTVAALLLRFAEGTEAGFWGAVTLFLAGIGLAIMGWRWSSAGYPEWLQPGWWLAEARRREGAGEILKYGGAWVPAAGTGADAGPVTVEKQKSRHFFGGRTAVHEGRGRGEVLLSGPLPRPVVIEIEKERAGALTVGMRKGARGVGRGTTLTRLGDGQRFARAVVDDLLLGAHRGLPHRRLTVAASSGGPWKITVRGPEAAREFDGRAEGEGAELFATGDAPLLKAGWAGQGAFMLRSRGPDLRSPDMEFTWLATEPGNCLIALLANGFLEVLPSGPGQWTLDARPDAVSAQEFAEAIDGVASAVLSYTGPSRRFTLTVGSPGIYVVDLLDPAFVPAAELAAIRGGGSREFTLASGSLIQVRGGPGAWSLS